MVEAGFHDVEVRALAAPMRLSSVANYVDFVRSAGSPVIRLVDALPPDQREAAWAEIARRLERFDTEAGWSGPNELLLVSGTRPVVVG
jgi:hypothetical protein